MSQTHLAYQCFSKAQTYLCIYHIRESTKGQREWKRNSTFSTQFKPERGTITIFARKCKSFLSRIDQTMMSTLIPAKSWLDYSNSVGTNMPFLLIVSSFIETNTPRLN